MCPAARTANIEVLHITAQLVLDWRVEIDTKAYARGDTSAASGGGGAGGPGSSGRGNGGGGGGGSGGGGEYATPPRLADRVAPVSVEEIKLRDNGWQMLNIFDEPPLLKVERRR